MNEILHRDSSKKRSVLTIDFDILAINNLEIFAQSNVQLQGFKILASAIFTTQK